MLVDGPSQEVEDLAAHACRLVFHEEVAAVVDHDQLRARDVRSEPLGVAPLLPGVLGAPQQTHRHGQVRQRGRDLLRGAGVV